MTRQQEPESTDPVESAAAGARPLLDALSHLYEATLEPSPWTRIMVALAPLFTTGKAMFTRVDRTYPSESVTEAVGITAGHIAALKGRDLDQDFLWRAVLPLPVGTVFRATDLASIEVMRSGPLYEQIAVPAGLEYVLGVILENTPSFFSNLCWMRAGDDFTAADKAILHTLVPHLQTALRISGRIAFGDAGRREALLSFDRARQPVVVLDRSGYAIFTNDSARRVLEKADGVALKFGRFLFQNILTQTEFERVVRLAMAATQRDAVPAPYEVRVPRRGPGTPYAMSVIPVSRSSDRAVLPDGAGCLILIYDLEVPNQLPVERLAWLYRLTPAEVRVCESLFRVGSVDSAALDLSLTRNTVRSHLKSVYTKFGVATQGQLMQRLANSLRLSEGIDREPAN